MSSPCMEMYAWGKLLMIIARSSIIFKKIIFNGSSIQASQISQVYFVCDLIPYNAWCCNYSIMSAACYFHC